MFCRHVKSLKGGHRWTSAIIRPEQMRLTYVKDLKKMVQNRTLRSWIIEDVNAVPCHICIGAIQIFRKRFQR